MTKEQVRKIVKEKAEKLRKRLPSHAQFVSSAAAKEMAQDIDELEKAALEWVQEDQGDCP